MKVLEANSLSKAYGNLKAVDDLSLAVHEGEIYGLLGLNGAGKTTTIRMFLDMIKPSAGTVKLFGMNVKSGDDYLNKVGYLVEIPSSYPELNVVENLEIYYRYRKLKDRHLIESIIHKLQLDAFRNVKTKNLSLGNKQRLGLAKALFHNPRLLILDEPTNGLDPAGIVEFRNLLKSLSHQGVTIFISSHLLDEVSRVASRIGIVHQGKLLREVDSAKLETELNKTLVIRARNIEKCKTLVSSLGYEVSVGTQSSELRCIDNLAVEECEQIAKQIVEADLGLKEIFIEKENLETYFLRQIAGAISHD
jgi:ABC-2 type transport system ATP-binding protein